MREKFSHDMSDGGAVGDGITEKRITSLRRLFVWWPDCYDNSRRKIEKGLEFLLMKFAFSFRVDWALTCCKYLISNVLADHAFVVWDSLVVVFVLPAEHWRSAFMGWEGLLWERIIELWGSLTAQLGWKQSRRTQSWQISDYLSSSSWRRWWTSICRDGVSVTWRGKFKAKALGLPI